MPAQVAGGADGQHELRHVADMVPDGGAAPAEGAGAGEGRQEAAQQDGEGGAGEGEPGGDGHATEAGLAKGADGSDLELGGDGGGGARAAERQAEDVADMGVVAGVGAGGADEVGMFDAGEEEQGGLPGARGEARGQARGPLATAVTVAGG